MQPLVDNTVNTPAFLGKLWKMVNDPSTDHLICWSASGNSFVIQNQAQFWYELLPLYYKHNNMSSFVRQLNMYGFHKLSTVENGTMDADKDEIQFTHPFFQKDEPELLRNIKRKATTAKASNENNSKHDDLTKVLTDVKQLRGRQASVDSQLNAMKQENALLWREVAILRQKHLKQQKIVNKLIQFLVTLVQPSRMTVGVKRPYQLMLNESPNKRSKVSSSKSNNLEGPTIHELDSELDLTPNLVYDDDPPLVDGSNLEGINDTIDSPVASVGSQPTDLTSPLPSQLLVDDNEEMPEDVTWDKPEYVNANSPVNDMILTDQDLNEENLIESLENGSSINSDKVFLNQTAQDTLLSNLMKSNNPISVVNKDNKPQTKVVENTVPISQTPVINNNMVLATRDKNVCDVVKSMPSTSDSYSPDHLNNHIETTESELEQLKDILNGYNSFVDANALLGEFNKIPRNYKDVLNLFQDDPPSFGLNTDEKLMDSADPLVSGSELTPYSNSFDFTELFDDSLDGDTATPSTALTQPTPTSTVNTPQIMRDEPVFPAIQASKK